MAGLLQNTREHLSQTVYTVDFLGWGYCPCWPCCMGMIRFVVQHILVATDYGGLVKHVRFLLYRMILKIGSKIY